MYCVIHAFIQIDLLSTTMNNEINNKHYCCRNIAVENLLNLNLIHNTLMWKFPFYQGSWIGLTILQTTNIKLE